MNTNIKPFFIYTDRNSLYIKNINESSERLASNIYAYSANIDKNNNMVIPCKYKWVSDFNGGQASVETFAGEEYKIDKQGWRI